MRLRNSAGSSRNRKVFAGLSVNVPPFPELAYFFTFVLVGGNRHIRRRVFTILDINGV